MKTRLVLPLILLIVIFSYGLVALAHPALTSSGVQKWEYAQVIFNTTPRFYVSAMPDVNEQKVIDTNVNAVPDKQFGTITVLNTFGGYGWELTAEQFESGLISLIFKRPLS